MEGKRGILNWYQIGTNIQQNRLKCSMTERNLLSTNLKFYLHWSIIERNLCHTAFLQSLDFFSLALENTIRTKWKVQHFSILPLIQTRKPAIGWELDPSTRFLKKRGRKKSFSQFKSVIKHLEKNEEYTKNEKKKQFMFFQFFINFIYSSENILQR